MGPLALALNTGEEMIRAYLLGWVFSTMAFFFAEIIMASEKEKPDPEWSDFIAILGACAVWPSLWGALIARKLSD